MPNCAALVAKSQTLLAVAQCSFGAIPPRDVSKDQNRTQDSPVRGADGCRAVVDGNLGTVLGDQDMCCETDGRSRFQGLERGVARLLSRLFVQDSDHVQ